MTGKGGGSRPAPRLRAVVFFLFFLSGMSALMYEVVWARHLRLVFGDTVFAVTTVLAAFMAGLALGGLTFGRYVDSRRAAALRIYAFLEIGIGLYALLFPLLLKAVSPLCILFIEHFRADFLATGLFRFALCFVIMLPATTLMGGTLPVLGRHFIRRLSGVGGNIGALYAVNTLGAVAGSLLPAFYLIGRIGVRNTTAVAVAVNVFAGLVVLAMDRGRSDHGGAVQEEAGRRDEAFRETLPASSRVLAAVPWLFALSGFAALAYEVLWTRLLIYVVGLDVQAFSMVLATFLGGLTLGSLLYTRLLGRLTDPLTAFLFLEILIGFGALLSVPLFRAFSLLPPEALREFALSSWGNTLSLRFARSALVMLVPTVAMGAAFPAAARLCVQRLRGVGSTVGALYGLNTAGGIFGAVAGGFILIPLLGIQRGIVIVALLNLLIAAALVVLAPELLRRRQVRAGLLAALVALPGAVALAAVFFDSPIVLESHRSRGKQVLYYEEGISTSIAVLEDPASGVREVNVNGMSLAFTDYWDFRVQKMLAHLPILLHEDPRRILMIAFGSGGSSGAAALHGIPIDGVELEEAQQRTAPFFRHVNYDILDSRRHPDYRLHIDDGRNWLLSRDRRYDVISRDTLPPKRSQDLFSKEFYELCRRRLTPAGVMCAFLPTDVCFDEGRFRQIVRTFQDVFPHASLWYVGPEFLLLVGTGERLDIDYGRFRERMGETRIRRDLEIVNLEDPAAFLSHFLMAGKQLEAFLGPGEVITDDRPIGFVNAREMLAPGHDRLISERILRHRTRVRPFLRNLGSTAEEAARVEAELERYYLATGHLITGRAFHREGELAEAGAAYRRALELQPRYADARYNRALALADLAMEGLERDEPGTALAQVAQALEIIGEEPRLLYILGAAREALGEAEEAKKAYGRSLEILRDRGYPPIPAVLERLTFLGRRER